MRVVVGNVLPKFAPGSDHSAELRTSVSAFQHAPGLMRNSITGCAVEQCAFCGASLVLNSCFWTGSKYFAPLVEHFVNKLGYTRQKDLWGAAYDWRLSPSKYILVVVVVNAIW